MLAGIQLLDFLGVLNQLCSSGVCKTASHPVVMFQVGNDTNGSNRLLFDELFGLGSSSSSDTEDEVLRNCSCRKYSAQ